jgi:cytochrome c peroxidase
MKSNNAVLILTLTVLCGTAAAGESGATIPSFIVDTDFYEDGTPAEARVELGRLLFFDKILSGNRNIACATCHHADLASGDGVALPLGEGPTGLGDQRRTGSGISESVHERVPRNSPALFNLGAREFTRLFHDGRVETDPEGYYEAGFITPAKWKLPKGLENVLAAQAMFPVTSPTEMAGQKGENDVANAVSLNNAAGQGGAWELLARRLSEIPEYVEMFKAAYPKTIRSYEDIRYVNAANAIATFEASAFRADNSPFDRHLRGGKKSLTPWQKRGMKLFYGKAKCGSCHSGTFQTDHDFHAIAMPQIGPGKGDGNHGDYWKASGHQSFLEDFGRGRVSVRPEDNFKFRTPSLRNVALTGPWGHAGAYATLEDVVRHHLDPVASLDNYALVNNQLPAMGDVIELTASGAQLDQERLTNSRKERFLMRDGWVQRNPELRGRIAAANELQSINLTDDELDELVAFLHALTDPASRNLSELVPPRVPSGLPVKD